MIRINKISEENKDSFYKDNIERLMYALKKVENYMCGKMINEDTKNKVIKLLAYLKNNTNLYQDERLKNLLIGNRDILISIIKEVGTIDDKNISSFFEHIYINFTNRKLGKEWAKKIGVDICPYCNRVFTDTVINGGVRPQYDHYFIKSDYPYLALSMYNLVPCCPICNSKKGKYDTYKEYFIYPFEEEYGDEVYFKVKESDNVFSVFDANERNIKLELIFNNESLRQKVEETNKRLKILELYENRSSFINRLLYLKHNIYVDEYIESLKKIEGFSGLSPSELDYLIYGKYLEKENWDKDILAKLAHDIVKME